MIVDEGVNDARDKLRETVRVAHTNQPWPPQVAFI